MVAMRSAASYWKSLYNIFKSSDLNSMVVNASGNLKEKVLDL